MIQYKRQGETALRNSGLGYTIIRPGNLIEEPGGYKALAFDQGNRLSDTIISCADVADVCVKVLLQRGDRRGMRASPSSLPSCCYSPCAPPPLTPHSPASRYTHLRPPCHALPAAVLPNVKEHHLKESILT